MESSVSAARMMNSGRPRVRANPTVLAGFGPVSTGFVAENPKKQQENVTSVALIGVGAFVLILIFLRK